jgi:hypothetical protein
VRRTALTAGIASIASIGAWAVPVAGHGTAAPATCSEARPRGLRPGQVKADVIRASASMVSCGQLTMRGSSVSPGSASHRSLLAEQLGRVIAILRPYAMSRGLFVNPEDSRAAIELAGIALSRAGSLAAKLTP